MGATRASYGLGHVPGRGRTPTINIGLKGRRRVRKPERHNDIFVMPVTGTKRRLLLVALTDSNTIINIPKIEFKKYSGLIQAV
jgi:hypothetical protein